MAIWLKFTAYHTFVDNLFPLMMMQEQISRRAFFRASAAGLSVALSHRLLAADEADVVPRTHELLRRDAEHAPLAMQFRGQSREEFQQWHESFAAKLRSLLGPHTPPAKWKTITENVVELKDHTRQELVLVAEGHPSLPVYLLLPKGETKPARPGVVAIHGHGDFGSAAVVGRDDLPGVARAIAREHYDYGRQLVRRGYAVAAPCMTPFGRRIGSSYMYRGEHPCAVTFVRMQLLGRVLMAENLRDCLWAVEMLARREEVDATRLACVGLSYGGRMAMLTSALEPRIRVCVSSGALNVMQERIRLRYSCGAQVIPGLLRFGDVPEISSLIAPRHCIWEIGSRDSLISADWAEAALSRMRRAYTACGAADRLMIDRFDGGHRWSGRVAYPLMKKLLRPPA